MKYKLSVLLFVTSAFITTSASANMICDSFGSNQYICDVYNGAGSEENTYFWTGSGGLQISSSGSFIALVRCQYSYGGTVTVTTTYPDGSTETMSSSINCGGFGF
ncbi:MAG: hypothetical protein JKY19_01355 [Alcanivoracaceae bacterium]|nr:hypothetical protein [Alcanivoracaceae bacterium]